MDTNGFAIISVYHFHLSAFSYVIVIKSAVLTNMCNVTSAKFTFLKRFPLYWLGDTCFPLLIKE